MTAAIVIAAPGIAALPALGAGSRHAGPGARAAAARRRSTGSPNAGGHSSPGAGGPSSTGVGGASGGAPLLTGGLSPVPAAGATPAVPAPAGAVPPPPGRHARGRWLSGVTITQYWPAPESWFVGRLVSAPGLTGRHRIDWLYSAQGVSMQGAGIGLDGRLYHIQALGRGGWVTSRGLATSSLDGWAAGPPYWRAGNFWRGRGRSVTFPLAAGGWSDGRGHGYVPLRGIRFAAGPALPLSYWRSLAVDPSVIPLGSRVYVPAYRDDGYGGWFVAQDTGGAIGGRHIDVYRPPPPTPLDPGGYLTGARIFVIAPHRGH